MNAHVSPPSTDIDAELIELGRKLKTAWRIENAVCQALENVRGKEAWAKITAVCDATRSIVHRIEAIKAHSLAGINTKALALAWCHAGEELEDMEDQPTDARLAAGLLRDLIAMNA